MLAHRHERSLQCVSALTKDTSVCRGMDICHVLYQVVVNLYLGILLTPSKFTEDGNVATNELEEGCVG